MKCLDFIQFTEWSSRTLKLYRRSYLQAILLLTLQNLWILFPIVIESKGYNQTFLESNLFSVIEQTFVDSNQLLVLYITFGINLAFVLFFIIDISIYSLLSNKAATKNHKILQNLKKILSFVLLCYEYTILQPSLNSSFASLPNLISFINILLCLLLGNAAIFTDYDYTFRDFNKTKDFLQNGFHLKYKIGKIVFYIIYFASKNLLEVTTNSSIGLLIGLYQTLSQLKIKLYRDQQIRIFYHFLSIQLTFISIAAIIQQGLKLNNFLSFVFLIQIAVSFLASKLFEKYSSNLERYTDQIVQIYELKRQFINSNNILSLAFSIVDQIQINFTQYTINHNSLFLESISVFHHQNCKQYPNCFCFSDELNQQESLLDENKRRQYMYSFVNKLLKYQSKLITHHESQSSKRSLDINFAYIHFLIEVSKSSNLALLELNNLLKYKQATWYEKIYINYLRIYIEQAFSEDTHFGKKLQQTLSYEENLLKALNIYEDCLLSKLSMLSLINQNFIDINLLNKTSGQLLLKKNKLLDLLQILSKSPNKNPIFVQLIQGFYVNFSHFRGENYFLENYNQRKQQSKILKNRNNSQLQDQHIDIYDEKACIIQVGIQGKELGKILYAQSLFYQMFKHTQKTFFHIDQIIPYTIQLNHKQLFNKYLTSFQCQQKNKMHFNLLLGQNSEGWGVPIKMKLQITHLTLNSDICVTALFKQIENKSSYLMCNLPNTDILISDKKTYKKLFKNIIKPNDMKKILLSKLIPFYFLKISTKDSQQDKYSHTKEIQLTHQTLLLIPKSNYIQKLQELTTPLSYQNFVKYINDFSNETHQVYTIQFSIKPIRNQYFSHDIIEFISIERLRNISYIQFQLQQYQDEMQNMLIKYQEINQIQGHNQSNPIGCDLLYSKRNNYSQKIQYQNPQSTVASIHQEDFDTNRVIEQQDKELIYSQRSLGYMSQRSRQLISQESNSFIEQINLIKLQIKQNLENQPRLISNDLNEIFSNNDLLDNQEYKNDILDKKQLQQRNNFSTSKLENQQIVSSSSRIRSEQYLQYQPKRNQLAKPLNIIQEIDQSQIDYCQNNRQIIDPDKSKISFKTPQQNSIYQQTYMSDESQSDRVTDRKQGLKKIKSNVDEFNYMEDEVKSKQISISKFCVKQQKPIQQQQNQYQSSMVSSDNSSNIKKLLFIQKVMKVKQNKSLFILQLIGFLGTITLLCLQILTFVSINKHFQLEKEHFQNVAWPMEIRVCNSLQLYYLQFIKFQANNIFSTQDDQSWKDLANKNKERIIKVNQHFDDLQIQFIRSNKDDFPYFKNITNFKIQYKVSQDYYIQNKIITRPQVNSFQYFQFYWFYGIRRFSADFPNSINDEAIFNLNFIYYFNPNTELQQSIETTTLDILTIVEDSVQNLMIISIIITFLIISSIMPVYLNIQNKNESILKLFSTFDPQAIYEMVQNLDSSIKKVIQTKKNILNHLAHRKQLTVSSPQTQMVYEQVMRQLYLNPKNKLISSTNQLKKVSILVTVSCLFIFLGLIIQPIANNFLISSLIDQQIFNLKLMSKFIFDQFLIYIDFQKIIQRVLSKEYRSYLFTPYIFKNSIILFQTSNNLFSNFFNIETIYDLKAHFGSNLYLNMGNLLERMCQDCEFFDKTYFRKRVNVFFDLNQQKLSNLQSVVTNENGYKRFNQDLYNKFLFKVMQGDICQSLRDFPEYLDPSFTLNYDKCIRIQKNILTKGFQISSKYLVEIFPPLLQLSQNIVKSQAQKDIKKWAEEINLLEFDEFIDIMLNTITALKNFMVEMSSQYISYAESIELWLLLFYCFFLILFIFFAYRLIFIKMAQSLISTRQMLSLIDINYLYSNPFIVNFINKL